MNNLFAHDDSDLREGRYQSAAYDRHAVDRTGTVSCLRDLLREYLKLRGALGCRIYVHGRELRHFVQFVERAGAAYITNDLGRCRDTEPPKGIGSQRSSKAYRID